MKGGLKCCHAGNARRTGSIANLFGFLRKTRFVFVTQKAVAVMLLLSFGCALLPIPSIRSSGTASLLGPSKDCSEPYPCQNCRCGCASAEQCWTSCCCYSLRERLAWARKNNVVPPAFVSYLMEIDTDSKPCSPQQESVSDRSDAISGAASGARANACCSSRAKSCCTENKGSSKVKSRGSKGTLSILALRCQGKVSLFSMLPWFNFDWCVQSGFKDAPASPLSLMARDDWESTVYPPDTPPPKFSAALVATAVSQLPLHSRA